MCANEKLLSRFSNLKKVVLKTLINTGELEFEETAHGAGLKKIIMRSSDTSTNLTQFAYGKLFPGEKIPEHLHSTMEEIFYFLKGEGTYNVDNIELHVQPETVVRIPAGVPHSLITKGTAALEFIYFGVATGN